MHKNSKQLTPKCNIMVYVEYFYVLLCKTIHISISINIDAKLLDIEFRRKIFNHHGVLIHVYRISHQILSDLHSYTLFSFHV